MVYDDYGNRNHNRNNDNIIMLIIITLMIIIIAIKITAIIKIIIFISNNVKYEYQYFFSRTPSDIKRFLMLSVYWRNIATLVVEVIKESAQYECIFSSQSWTSQPL